MIKSLAKIFVAGIMVVQIFGINAFAGNNEVLAAREQAKIDASTGPAFAVEKETKLDANLSTEVKKEDTKVRTVTSNGKTYRVSKELGQFKTTAFTPMEKGNGITATRVKPTLNNTVSADWTQIPAGTKILIGDSDIVYTVEDTGVKGKVVDIFLATNREAIKYGVQYKTIFVLEEVK